MDEEIRNLFKEEITKRIEEIRDLPVGSKEYDAAVENVTRMYKTLIEDMHAEYDYSDKYERRDSEAKFREKEFEENTRLKEEELKDQKKHQWIKVGLDVANLVLPAALFLGSFDKGLAFEKDGTIVTPWMRALINAITPKFFRK